MIIPPCKDCPDRKVGCHSVCEKYIEWKKDNERTRSMRFKAGNIESSLIQIKNGGRIL